MRATDSKRLPVRQLAELSIFCAIMVAGKEAMNALPNIHPIMLLIILCARRWRLKALYPVAGFVIIESLIYGLSIWTVSYLYIWPLYTLAAAALAENDSRLFWSIFAALCGLLFGALSALTTLVIAGFRPAVAYFVAGIPFDAVHCVSNFIIVFLLYPRLMSLLSRFPVPDGGIKADSSAENGAEE